MSFAISQAIETQRGLVPAGEIVPGDRVRGWHDGTWNTVDAVSFGEDEIVRVEVNDETILAGSRARFISRLLCPAFDSYALHVPALCAGLPMPILGVDGSRYVPKSVEKIGIGKCVELRLAEARNLEMKMVNNNQKMHEFFRDFYGAWIESRCIRIGKFVAWN